MVVANHLGHLVLVFARRLVRYLNEMITLVDVQQAGAF